MKKHLLLIAALLMAAGAVIGQGVVDYFQQATDDSQTTTLYFAPHDEQPPEEVVTETDATLAAILATMPYSPLLPGELPAGYTYDFADYDANGSQLRVNYRCAGMWGLEIVQRPISAEALEGLTPVEVGASAVIEEVQIGTALGQYTRGFWVPQHKQPLSPDQPEVTTTRVWDNDAPWHYLFWHQDGRLYIIMTSSGSMMVDGERPCMVTKADLVTMAESVAAVE